MKLNFDVINKCRCWRANFANLFCQNICWLDMKSCTASKYFIAGNNSGCLIFAIFAIAFQPRIQPKLYPNFFQRCAKPCLGKICFSKTSRVHFESNFWLQIAKFCPRENNPHYSIFHHSIIAIIRHIFQLEIELKWAISKEPCQTFVIYVRDKLFVFIVNKMTRNYVFSHIKHTKQMLPYKNILLVKIYSIHKQCCLHT